MIYLRNYEPDRWPAGNPETGYLNTDGSPTKTVILEARTIPGMKKYWEWNFGDGNISSDQHPLNTYPDTGTYQVSLVVSNEFECFDEKVDYVLINPYFRLEVPNAFTPGTSGGNGGLYDINSITNDVFFPFTDYISEFRMMIFNRWGELLFESFDINRGWDGYYLGQLCQQDVYVWKIEVTYTDGSTETKVGDLTLIR